MRYEYSTGFDTNKSARSQTYDANVSYKDLTQVCKTITGKPVLKAMVILENAIDGIKPIIYKTHAKGSGHKSQLSGKQGKFPNKASKLMLKLLKNAYSNAQSKGIDEKSIVVLHAAAFKQNVYPRYKKYFASGNVLGYGKYAMFSNYSTARVELIVGQAGLLRVKKPTKAQLKLMKKNKVEKQPAKSQTTSQVSQEQQKVTKSKVIDVKSETKPTETKNVVHAEKTSKSEVKPIQAKATGE